MSDNFAGMFNNETTQEVTTGARSLEGTAQLTMAASGLAADCLKKMDADIEIYKDDIAASKVSHDAMDALILKTIDLSEQNVDFLKELSEATLEAMLKSQQSKRSRTKSKAMTMDNYRSMMTAAFAEHLLRLAMGKAKSATGTRRFAGQVSYTAEELAALAADQLMLRKEIRNIQSKKSIFKSKEDFSETDPKYLEILKTEEELKSLRTGVVTTKPTTIVVDETKNKLAELMAQVSDIGKMKSSDAKKLLEQIQQLTAAPQPDTKEPNDTPDPESAENESIA